MVFQKFFFKTFLTAALLLMFSLSVIANNDEAIRYELTLLNSKELNVKIIKPRSLKVFEYSTFLLYSKIPNYYLPVSNLNKIDFINIAYDNKIIDKKVFSSEMRIWHDFKHIEYTVNLNTVNNNSFLPINSYVSTQAYGLLNFSSFLGVIKEFQNDSIYLSLKNENGKLIYSQKGLFNNIVERPLCLNCKSLGFVENKLSFKLELNKNEQIGLSSLKKLLDEVFSIINKIGIKAVDKEKINSFIFLFDNATTNTGAIAHENNIVFHFNTNDKFLIQKTFLHEILHWVFKDQESWLTESMAEYLAIKLLLVNNLITKEKFLEVFSKKLNLAENYSNISLEEIYKTPKYYEALYSKGACYALFYDITIMNKFNYYKNFESYLYGLKPPKGIESKDVTNEMKWFDKDFIIDNKSFSYNNLTNKLGILFEKNKLIETNQKQLLKTEEIDNKLIIVDNANIQLLKPNDIIISVNGIKKIDKIQKSLSTFSQKNTSFVLLRNKQKVKMVLENISVMKNLKFHLSFLENPTEEQKVFWDKFLN